MLVHKERDKVFWFEKVVHLIFLIYWETERRKEALIIVVYCFPFQFSIREISVLFGLCVPGEL